MPKETAAAAVENKQQEEEKRPKEPPYRFPAVAPQTAEFTVQLPPFPDAPEGFSGSLETLLEHLRAKTLPVETLPLAPLVDQYVGYCERLVEQEDPHERMSDFVPLAATLIHLKSRLLLPQENVAEAPDQPSVGEEIVEEIRRQEHRRNQEQAAIERVDVAEFGPPKLTLLDLMVLLNDVQSTFRGPLSVSEDELTVRDAIRWIRHSLPDNACLDAETYFAQCVSRQEQAAVFLAILELGKSQAVSCHQAEAFAPIWLFPQADASPSIQPV